MEFFIPLQKVPTVTHQEKQITKVRGKYIFYEPTRLIEARKLYEEKLFPFRPERPLDVPVRLIVKWLFPLSKGKKDGQWKYTKPDTDNLNKLLKDVMTDLGFWKDDALVCSEIIEKFWAKQSGIYIKIEELEA